jgi:SAM-dependent methyltransferase
VLELGPLEGGHSFMFERLGAREVIAIEANPRAYLKCLIIKELLDLRRVRFLCGDFLEYLRADGTDFDLVFASGVLYHMRNLARTSATNPIGKKTRVNRNFAACQVRGPTRTNCKDDALFPRPPSLDLVAGTVTIGMQADEARGWCEPGAARRGVRELRASAYRGWLVPTRLTAQAE